MSNVKIWHTGYTVSDIERTSGFFREVLGFVTTPPVSLPDKSIAAITGVADGGLKVAFVHAPGHTIELLEFRWNEAKDVSNDAVNNLGRGHIAFTVEALETSLSAATKWGWTLLNEPFVISNGSLEGWRICYAIDADGLLIEFAEPKVDNKEAPTGENSGTVRSDQAT